MYLTFLLHVPTVYGCVRSIFLTFGQLIYGRPSVLAGAHYLYIYIYITQSKADSHEGNLTNGKSRLAAV